MTSTTSDRKSILEEIRDGMKVIDREQKEIGKVKAVFFGAEADEARVGAPLESTDGLDLHDAFDHPEKLPDTLRKRLLYHGFIQIDTSGLLQPDMYAMPDQVTLVDADSVYLMVTKDELLKK